MKFFITLNLCLLGVLLLAQKPAPENHLFGAYYQTNYGFSTEDQAFGAGLRYKLFRSDDNDLLEVYAAALFSNYYVDADESILEIGSHFGARVHKGLFTGSPSKTSFYAVTTGLNVYKDSVRPNLRADIEIFVYWVINNFEFSTGFSLDMENTFFGGYKDYVMLDVKIGYNLINIKR